MLEIQIHGRGGQGAQVACQILAAAFLRAGSWVQAFAAYGGERRGAPVVASLRVDAEPVRLCWDVTEPDLVLVLDASLLEAARATLREHGTVVVNAPVAPCSRMPGGTSVAAIDASAIAREHGLGPIVATAVLGAFVAATGLLSLDDLLLAVEECSPAKTPEHVAACVAGHREVWRDADAAEGLERAP